MSTFKVTFTLKQHTPIIHFQSEQSGATLRATELKPKFDRFLKEHAFDGEIPEKFLITQDKDALDYKVKIIPKNKEISLPNSLLYFANNAVNNDNEKKHTVKTISLDIEFFTFNTKLLQKIEKYFNDFLLITNFGSRSSKGYGSFTYKTDNASIVLNKYYPNMVFKISNVGNINNWEDKIDTIHKRLKSGINYKQYHKSLLFQYMCETYNVGWEKKFIKKHFPEVIHGDKQPIICTDDKEYRYIRAVLGLAEHNEFGPVGGKKQIKIKSSDKNIERFKSPITFKVFNNQIYLLFNDSYKKILDKEFSFNGKMIKTPKEFDLYEFLKYVEKQENLIQEVK